MSWLDDIRGILGQAQEPLRAAVPNAPQAIRNLGDSLSQSGEAIAGLPGNLTRGIGTTLGQLASGNDAAPDTARRTLDSVLFPSRGVSGGEVLRNAGVENPSPAADFAAGLATDPSALVGGAQLARAGFNTLRGGGAALSRMLAPEAAQGAGTSSAAARGLLEAEPGLSGWQQGASGWQRTPALPTQGASGVGASGETLFGGGGGNIARDTAGLPSRMSATADMLAPQNTFAPGAARDSRGLSNLRDLRNQFTVIRDAGLDSTNSPTFGRMVGGNASASDAHAAVESILNQRGVQGAFAPSTGTATIAEGALPGTARHEIFHGLMDSAREAGNGRGLSLPARAMNLMQQSRSPLLQGLGYTGEEALAHGVGNGRGFMAQAGGAMRFLANPSPTYYHDIANISPAAGFLYNNGPRIAVGTGAGAAGAGGSALYNALGN